MTWDWIPRDEARQIEDVWAMEDAREERRKKEWRQKAKYIPATTASLGGSLTNTNTGQTYSASYATNTTVTDWVVTREGEGKGLQVDKPRSAQGGANVSIPAGTKLGSGCDSSDVHFKASVGFWLTPTSASLELPPCGLQVCRGDRLVWNAGMGLLTIRHGDYSLDDPRFKPGIHVPRTSHDVDQLLQKGWIEAAPSVPEGTP